MTRRRLAGPDVVFGVEGVDELVRQMRKMADHDLQSKVRKATRETVREVIVPEVLERVPVWSGLLKRSVKASASATSASVTAGHTQRAPHVWLVHDGHEITGAVTGGGRVEGRPFLRDGIKAGLAAYYKQLYGVIEEIAAEFGGRHGAKVKRG